MKLCRSRCILLSLLCGIAVVGCGHSSPDDGEPLVKLIPEQLGQAESILVGRVTDVTSHQSDAGSIYTLVTLNVEQAIKGPEAAEVVIRLPGGSAGELEMVVTDTVSFEVGERAVIFLKKGEDYYTVVGGLLGKYIMDENGLVSGILPLTVFIDQINEIQAKQ